MPIAMTADPLTSGPETFHEEPGSSPPRRWQPVSATDRRVLGVLVEKAKTTPDVYPMSVNALVNGANQKNNRFPLMLLETDDIEESLERLRGLGAVAEVQGGGRVSKFRHYLYEWLGVDKIELAVMAELLLRGAQTEGELRGRAARMEPIADLAALRPLLDSLKAKGLVASLTAAGRGHVVTHTLYLPDELARVRSQFSTESAAPARGQLSSRPPSATGADSNAAAATRCAPETARESSHAPALPAEVEALRRELGDVRGHVRQLREELDELTSQLRQKAVDVQEIKDSLGL
jgi:uncharacterized protein